jgi:HSP20 family protein
MADQQVTQSAENRTQSAENRSVARRGDALSPFAPVRREMERLFEDFFSVFGVPTRGERESAPLPAGIIAPRIDVSETDDEVRITAELPGLSEDDVEVRLIDDVLTIRGECQTEQEDEEQDYRVIERARGTFVRSLRLPFSADPSEVQASFKNGVLTIRIPKPQEARERVQRIEVKRDESGNGQAGNGQAGDKQRSAKGSQSAAQRDQKNGQQDQQKPQQAQQKESQTTAG